jgi:hypothetical protein
MRGTVAKMLRGRAPMVPSTRRKYEGRYVKRARPAVTLLGLDAKGQPVYDTRTHGLQIRLKLDTPRARYLQRKREYHVQARA